MSHDDFEAEPDPSAPGHLPKGEVILWQGSPDGLSLAWRVYHLREVTAYFAVLLSWRAFSSWWETGLIAKVMSATLPLMFPLAIAALLLVGLGYLSARTTRYTITNSRLVMRTGIAMPGTLNLPFSAVKAASHRDNGQTLWSGQSGDIGVEISEGKIAYLMLWPHVRPWQLRNPQPMMRCIPDSAGVANILVQALSGEASATVVKTVNVQPAKPMIAVPPSGILDGQLAT